MANEYWVNPSMSARIWNPRGNAHIEPGEKIYEKPPIDLVQSGKLLHVAEEDTPELHQGPVRVSAAIEMDFELDGLPISLDEDVDEPVKRKRKNSK